MKRVLLAVCLLFATVTAFSQRVEPAPFYTRDNAGNVLLDAWNSNERALASARYISFRWVNSNFQYIKFRLLYPSNYNPSRKYPLLLFLHGRGEAGGNIGGCGSLPCYQNNEKNLLWWGREMMRANQGGNLDGSPWANPPYDKSYPAFYLVPQEDDGYWTGNQSENGFMRFIDPNTGQPYPTEGKIRLVLDLIEYMANGGQPTAGIPFNIDPNKVYVHGLSAGGGGTFDVLYRRPDLFAGAIPYSVGGDRSTYVADLMKYISIWTFQGGQDDNPVYSVSQEVFNKYTEPGRRVFSRDKNAVFRNFGSSSGGRYIGNTVDIYTGNKRYTIVPNNGHGVWFDAYDHPDIFRWLFSQSQLDIKTFGDTVLNGGSVRIGIQQGFAQYEWQYSADNNSYNTTYLGGGTVGSSNEITVSASGYYKVRFRRNATGWTNLSAPIRILNSSTDTQAPTIPSGLTASNLTATGFTLGWNASNDNVGVTGYDVFRNGVKINGSNIAGTTYAVTGLSGGTTYGFTVTARDAAGNISNPSSVLNVTTTGTSDTQAPSTPTGLTATSLSATDFTLGWNASTDNVGVTGYDIFRNGTKINGNNISGTTFNVSGLTPLTTFLFTVVAKDAAGNTSNASSTLSVTTLGNGTGQAEATWLLNFGNQYSNAVANYNNLFPATFPVAVGTAYNNLIKNDGSVSTANFVLTSAISGGGNLVSCANAPYAGAATGSWWRVENNEVFSSKFTGLTSGKTYTLVFYHNSSADNATAIYTVNGVSKTLNGLNNCTNTAIFDNISPNASGEIAFNLSRNTGYYQVGINVLELRQFSSGAADTQAPSTPAGLTATSVSATGFTLGWNASTDNVGVTGYDIFRNGTKINGSNISGTTFNVSGLTPLTTYLFTVVAKDAAGNTSNPSNALSVTTANIGGQATLESTWLLNFGWQYSTAVNGYNNLFPASFPIAVNTSYNLNKNDGTTSPTRLVITQAIPGGGGAAACGSGIYASAAANSWWRVQSNETMGFKFTGLATNKFYSLNLLLSSGSNNAISNFTINGITKSLSGLNNCSTTVSFTDLQPNASGEITIAISRNGGYFESGINVAELRQYSAAGGVAFKGTQATTKVESQRLEEFSNENLQFAPNPTQDMVSTHYFAEKEGNMNILVSDILGRQMQVKQLKLVQGINKIEVDLTSNDSGVYYIRLGESKSAIVRKIVLTK